MTTGDMLDGGGRAKQQGGVDLSFGALIKLDRDSAKLLRVRVHSIQAKMRSMARLGTCLLAAAIALLSCAQPTSLQTVVRTEASTLKNRIPAADPSKYRSLADSSEWQNPYLLVSAKGVDARPISVATETLTMSPADVVAYLEKLPSIKWSCGLLVAVQENGLRALGDDARFKTKREELMHLLEKAGVKVELWPPA